MSFGEKRMQRTFFLCCAMVLLTAGCGGSGGDQASPKDRGPGGMGPGQGAKEPSAAVPVKVEVVTLGAISRHIETNGTLEAENEVDIVARTVGPITELLVEEGDRVTKGQLLARIDDREALNQAAISRVSRDEAQLAFDRAQTTLEGGLVSQEAYDAAVSKLQTAKVQLESAELQLAYTEIRAPFSGQVAIRYVKRAQYVTSGTSLFRISAFDPLLCPIEVPEKDLGRIAKGQSAHLEVEAFPEERFEAKVERIRPTLEAATGTVTVTLEVDAQGKLRPGMFARVYLEIDRHDGVVVIPREAMVLDSIGDTVFVRTGDVAERREINLGFREGESVEVLEGLRHGEELIVLGQEGLADQTPVSVLDEPASDARPGPSGGPDGELTPERLEEITARMRDRGMSDDEIAERIEQMKTEGSGAMRGGRPGGPPPGGPSPENLPPRMVERIREASDDDLELIKGRMQQFGMSEEQVEEIVRKIRQEDK